MRTGHTFHQRRRRAWALVRALTASAAVMLLLAAGAFVAGMEPDDDTPTAAAPAPSMRGTECVALPSACQR